MRKFGIFTIFFLFCIFYVAAKPTATLYVAVQKAAVKSSTGFFAKTLANVVYGDKVIVHEEKKDWVQVSLSTNPSVTGWVSASSLTSKKIIIRSSSGVSASANEMALAGKGFNKQIEDTYKQDRQLNYQAVDAMENAIVQPEDLELFIIEGNLKGSE